MDNQKPKKKPAPKKVAPKKAISDEMLKLGNRIKQLRIEQGYTNYEYFAYENDLPRAQYGRYENGEDLKYSNLLKVVKAFGISMQEFFSKGFD